MISLEKLGGTDDFLVYVDGRRIGYVCLRAGHWFAHGERGPVGEPAPIRDSAVRQLVSSTHRTAS